MFSLRVIEKRVARASKKSITEDCSPIPLKSKKRKLGKNVALSDSTEEVPSLNKKQYNKVNKEAPSIIGGRRSKYAYKKNNQSKKLNKNKNNNGGNQGVKYSTNKNTSNDITSNLNKKLQKKQGNLRKVRRRGQVKRYFKGTQDDWLTSVIKNGMTEPSPEKSPLRNTYPVSLVKSDEDETLTSPTKRTSKVTKKRKNVAHIPTKLKSKNLDNKKKQRMSSLNIDYTDNLVYNNSPDTDDDDDEDEDEDEDADDWCPWGRNAPNDVNCNSIQDLSNISNVNLNKNVVVPNNIQSSKGDVHDAIDTLKMSELPTEISEEFPTTDPEDDFQQLKRDLVGKCVCVRRVNKTTLLLTMLPKTRLYLNGFVWVRQVLGNAAIYGYSLNIGEKVAMFSPSSQSLISINAVKGGSFNKDLRYKGFANSVIVCGNTKKEKTAKVVVVEVSYYSSSLYQLLPAIRWKKILPQTHDQVWGETLGVSVVNMETCDNFHLFSELPQWNELLQRLQESIDCDERVCVVLCGGKGVGKSTSLKTLINFLLSSNGHSESYNRRRRQVCCLDLDPGQPELSLPGTLSYTQLQKPLIGPSFTHNSVNNESQKQLLFGATLAQTSLNEYFAAVHDLVQYHVAGLPKNGNSPLIVNTMGWTHDTGLDVIVDIIRMVRPTHVVQLQANKQSSNFTSDLESGFINETNRGVKTSPKDDSVLDYELFKISSTNWRGSKFQPFRAKMLRDLSISSYFSSLWKSDTIELDNSTCLPPIEIPWTSVGLHVHHTHIPRSHILLAMNGALVSLCSVDKKYIEEVRPDLPKFISDSGTVDPRPSFYCHGWAIVTAINPDTRKFQLLTPVSLKTIQEKVNSLVLADIQLPEQLFKLFSKADATLPPYCQRGERSGKGKLSTGRHPKT